MRNRRVLASALCLCAGTSVAMADGVVVPGEGSLVQRYPGVMTTDYQGQIAAFFGRPMTQGNSAADAAARFVAEHADEFGAGDVELELVRSADLWWGRQTVFAYRQRMDGMPVEMGAARVLVLNGEDGSHQVTFASSKLASRPEGGFAEIAVTPEEAVARAQRVPRFRDLNNWEQPELVVYYGEGDFDQWIESVRAWKFVGEHTDVSRQQRYTFFVDASTGELLHARSEIHHQISGQVTGRASPNNTADHAGNPPVVVGIPEIRVRVEGSNPVVEAFTDRSGNFTIPWSGTAPVTLRVSVNDNNGAVGGRWAQVRNSASPGTEINLTQSVTPGIPATIALNPTTNEVQTAQVNAFVYTTTTRNFIRDRAPGFAELDTIGSNPATAVLPANVMVSGSCNAFYNGTSTNYYPVAGTCNNTAFASVVAHEYGHHIVNRLGLAQGAFGEGFSDVVSMLQFDDPIVGRFFQTNGAPVRTPESANQQFPCASGAIHTCGMIVGGSFWELRRNLNNPLPSGDALELARQLFVNWSLLTLGGQGLNSAHPTTVLELLAVDDTNGFFCDGTPNYNDIRLAFQEHGIASPTVEGRVQFSNPSAVSATSPVGQPVVFRLDVAPAGATFAPGAVRVNYRHASGNSFVSTPMVLFSGNTYEAVLPGVNCGQTLEWNVSVVTSQGTATYPFGCGNEPVLRTVGGTGVRQTLVTDGFETANPGWTVAAGSPAATTGAWVRGDPLGTAAQPEFAATGTNCWFTGQGTNPASSGEQDVDGGQTILTSPAFDLAGRQDVRVSYARWYSNGSSTAAPYSDVFRVQVSTNNGVTWTDAEVVGPGSASDPDVQPQWRNGQFALSSLGVVPTAQTRVRFIAEDLGAGSVVEAAIDDLLITAAVCSGCNDVDFNNDGVFPDDGDLLDLLRVLGGGVCSTGNCDTVDFNNDGVFPDDADVSSFLSTLGGAICP